MIDGKLIGLYQKTSKHSNYQVLAERVKSLLPEHEILVRSRYEKERLAYVSSNLDFSGFSVVDIGGNTGYFSFELIDKGVDRVILYEGNPEHCQFVSHAASLLKLEAKLIAKNEYVDFNRPDIPVVDCIFLLNVLHHVGDDFGNKDTRAVDVRQSIVSALRALSSKSRYLVFQLGFNWKGNPELPIFSAGQKSEVVSLVASVGDSFEIVSIGVAVKREGVVAYEDLNDDNVARNDALGEFLNRPLFILKSKNYTGVGGAALLGA